MIDFLKEFGWPAYVAIATLGLLFIIGGAMFIKENFTSILISFLLGGAVCGGMAVLGFEFKYAFLVGCAFTVGGAIKTAMSTI